MTGKRRRKEGGHFLCCTESQRFLELKHIPYFFRTRASNKAFHVVAKLTNPHLPQYLVDFEVRLVDACVRVRVVVDEAEAAALHDAPLQTVHVGVASAEVETQRTDQAFRKVTNRKTRVLRVFWQVHRHVLTLRLIDRSL